MNKYLLVLLLLINSINSFATIHIVNVWNGYYKFVDAINFSPDITIQLGDTVQWLPLDEPTMMHTITSTNIPVGAVAFDQVWQAPADTFFQYVPQIEGLYEYECTPHAISNGMVGSITVVGPNGIKDKISKEIHIYPNPTVNFLNIENSYEIKPYNIISLSGVLVQEGFVTNTIDVSTIKNGIYFLHIVGDKPKIIRFIKN